MARRKLYPLPVQGILDNPDFSTLPAAGAGMVFRLMLHYWASECRPMPVADHELRAVARAHVTTWREHKTVILQIFEAVRPDLEAYWKQRKAWGTNVLKMASAGGQATQAKCRRKLVEQAPAPLPPVYAMGFAPRRDKIAMLKDREEPKPAKVKMRDRPMR